MRQARYWIGTIPEAEWVPCLQEGTQHIHGQLEQGATTAYRHWQLVVSFAKKKSLSQVRICFGGRGHWEPTRSDAARLYVLKEDTRCAEPFEFGSLSIRRAESTDWGLVLESAKTGTYTEIPPDVLVRYYSAINRITADFAKPAFIERQCIVLYGLTGVGKSKRAWDEAGPDAYPKCPRSKFWCGYRGESNVVVDEFRGGIDIGHLLRWLDRYPVRVEVKGSSRVLVACKFWITSNLHPREWYPGLDSPTLDALLRRMSVKELIQPFA